MRDAIPTSDASEQNTGCGVIQKPRGIPRERLSAPKQEAEYVVLQCRQSATHSAHQESTTHSQKPSIAQPVAQPCAQPEAQPDAQPEAHPYAQPNDHGAHHTDHHTATNTE